MGGHHKRTYVAAEEPNQMSMTCRRKIDGNTTPHMCCQSRCHDLDGNTTHMCCCGEAMLIDKMVILRGVQLKHGNSTPELTLSAMHPLPNSANLVMQLI